MAAIFMMSNALMALEVGLFVVGVLALVAGRLYLLPRRFVAGTPARLTGLLLILPLLATFLMLFVLAFVAQLRGERFDPEMESAGTLRAFIMIFEGVAILFALGAAGALAASQMREDTLARRWFLTPQKMREQIPLVLFLAGIGLAGVLSLGLPLWKKLLIWSPLLPAFVYLLRRGSLKLFGPVLFYDLVRTGRRGRFILLRFLYCSLLFAVLCWVFFLWSIDYRYQNRANPNEHMAQMTDSYFYTFATLQLLIVLILTPAYTAGAIAEEKDRHTLEFLLATDLRNREIVLSKLVSRMANLTLMLIAGLPILALMQFLGGVDPGLLLAGFAATLLTMASLAALSIVMSVYAKKARDAIALTYLTVIAYATLPWLFGELLKHKVAWFVEIPLTLSADPMRVSDVIDYVNSGNLLKSFIELVDRVARSARLADELTDRLENYAIFHGIVIIFLAFWAVVRLRGVALAQTYGTVARLPAATRLFGRPRVGFAPMLWKEVFVEGGSRFGWLGRCVIGLLVILSFVPAVWIVIDLMYDWWSGVPTGGRGYGSTWHELGMRINIWARVAGTTVACFTLLGIAVRAAGSVSSERDKQTLDTLLTSPLDSDTILFAKWLGSILSVRWAWLWLGFMWLVSVVLGGVFFIAPVFLMGAWCVFASFVAMVGVWFSTVCRTTLRATVWTLVSLGFLGGGHWLAGWMCCYMPLAVMGVHERDFEYLLMFQAFGLTPPWTLGWLAFRVDDFDRVNYGSHNNPYVFTAFALMGLFGWATAAAILWVPTSARFRYLTGRERLKRPERRPIRQTPRKPPPVDGVAIHAPPATAAKLPLVHAVEDLPEVLAADEPPAVLHVEKPPPPDER